MSKRLKPRRGEIVATPSMDQLPPPRPSPRKGPLKPKTEAQRLYISAMAHARITFGIGPAGTGKTYCAARVAADALLTKSIQKIYLTRPAVEAGRPIGFLKGTMEEKMAPYIAAYGQGFNDGFGQGHFEYFMTNEKIEIVPLNFMQGRSFDEPCMVLFDEAQNATVEEMKMFLTRIGQGARMVIDGDPAQIMLDSRSKSGLIDGFERIRYLRGVSAIQFDREDIVRDGIVREILDAYDDTRETIEGDDQLDLPGFITGQ